MTQHTSALRFRCEGQTLIGVLHLPPQPLPRGLLLVTGGPQYRVGSHRQFVLLGRHLARAGIAVLRFDYRGMGDSEGAAIRFEQTGPDLDSAIQQFFCAVPALRELVLWGLCDGATAAALYAANDARISGLVLLNPWVHTEQGAARALLHHYYLQRLCQADFWAKLLRGRFRLRSALASLRQVHAHARGPGGPLPARLLDALRTFPGQILLILSGADLTANEFAALADSGTDWRSLLAAPRVRQVLLAQANHTFSRAIWRDEVAALCADWIASW